MDGNPADMETASIHAGLREYEVLDLKAFQVNLLNSTATLFHTKNHEPRTVSLNNTLQEMFARWLEGLDMGIKSGKILCRCTHFSVDSLRDVVVDLDRKCTEKKAGGQNGRKPATTILSESFSSWLVST
jgi:hypothetical protein